MLRPLFAIACLAAASSVAAEPVMMHKEVLQQTIPGALIELDTPTDTKIPVRFGEDGLVTGEAGDLAGILGAARDRGRWWVAGDRLCMKWFRWLEAEVRCLALRRDGDRVFWRTQDGKTGTATIVELAKAASKPDAPSERVAKAEAAPTPAASEEAADSTAPKAEETPVATMLSMQFTGAAAAFAAEPRIAAPVRAPEPMPGPASPSAPAEEPATQAEDVPTLTEEKTPAPALQAANPPTARAAQLPQPGATPRPARRAGPPQPPRAATPAAAPGVTAPSFRVVGVEVDDVLNVRSGPSEYYEPVGGIPPEGRGVRIVGPCQGSWCPIRHGRVSGWVNRYYLAEEDMRSAGSPGTAPIAAR